MWYADLLLADLTDAKLIGANLKGAKMEGINLREAIIDRADFSDADMRAARMIGVRGWETAKFADSDLRGAWDNNGKRDDRPDGCDKLNKEFKDQVRDRAGLGTKFESSREMQNKIEQEATTGSYSKTEAEEIIKEFERQLIGR